jgi:2-oxoglutarate dehydrogenase E1 component
MSQLLEFSERSFEEVIEDQEHVKATKLLFCSGKVYYDLIEEREKRKAHHIAIIRIEQLYPFPLEKVERLLIQHTQMKACAWVQEEHQNMGAYTYIAPYLREILPDNVQLCYVGRAKSASPAAGSLALHQQEKERFLKDAFGEETR